MGGFDDGEPLRFEIPTAAESRGHRVRAVAGVAAALEVLERHAPGAGNEPVVEVLITDVGLDDGNGWELAGRLAERMLPQIFRPDEPALALAFAPEHQRALEKLLESVPSGTFTASDALGWVYQFWQADNKEAINRSEEGILVLGAGRRNACLRKAVAESLPRVDDVIGGVNFDKNVLPCRTDRSIKCVGFTSLYMPGIRLACGHDLIEANRRLSLAPFIE